MKKLRVVFAGTPNFSIPSLETLIGRRDVEIVCVYTRPDSKAGRGLKLIPSPIKKLARSSNLSVRELASFSDATELEKFKQLKPDVLVVTAFGIILPKSIIEAPLLAINVHASLLPRWRGAAPIQRCISEGDKQTGISIMRMVEELDAGPVILQKSCAISLEDTSESMHNRLAILGGAALDTVLDQIITKSWSEAPQDEVNVTYASKITHEEGAINWKMSAEAIDRQIRSLHPKPGAYATISTIKVKIISAKVINIENNLIPGEVTIKDKNRMLIATGRGSLEIENLQVPGKKIANATTFINGYRKFL